MRPQPLPDELLSSWMIRLAHGNGFKLHTFYAHFFGQQRQIWNRDIDHHAPTWLLEGLAERTGLALERVRQTTLRAYESVVFERFNETGVTRGVLPVGVYHRVRRVLGQQFCPCCLAEDPVPYLRRQWRLSLVAACVRHAVMLEDRCGSCGQALQAHRGDLADRRGLSGLLDFARCACCGAYLGCRGTAADIQALEAQRTIWLAIESGFAWIGDQPVYSHLYFDGLRLLIAGLRRTGRFHGCAHQLEHCPATQRLEQLAAAVELTRHWPHAFLHECEQMRQPYTTFTRYATDIPYWLAAVLRGHLCAKPALLLQDEAVAIVEAHRTKTTSPSVAGRLCGRYLLNALPPRRVQDKIARGLFAYMALQIRRASGLRRLLLERDLAVFAIGRVLCLSSVEIVGLRLRDVPQLLSVAGRKPPDGTRAARLLASYIAALEPWGVTADPARKIFLGRGGQPIKRSTVGARFTVAKQGACICAPYLDWKAWTAPSLTSRQRGPSHTARLRSQ